MEEFILDENLGSIDHRAFLYSAPSAAFPKLYSTEY